MAEGLIITDLDGSLVDTKDINYRAYSEALRAFGYSIDYDFYCRECNGRHYLDFIPAVVPEENLWPLIHNKKKEAYSSYIEYGRVNTGLASLIGAMHGRYSTALVTTANRRNTEELLEHFGLDRLFDLVITREDVSKSKPNPEGFLKAMSALGHDARHTVIFEDSKPGLEAARLSGATVFSVNGFN